MLNFEALKPGQKAKLSYFESQRFHILWNMHRVLPRILPSFGHVTNQIKNPSLEA